MNIVDIISLVTLGICGIALLCCGFVCAWIDDKRVVTPYKRLSWPRSTNTRFGEPSR